MPSSAVWFILILLALPVAWLAGQRAGAIRDRVRRCCVVGGVFALLMGWTALIKHPTVAIQLIPISVLARVEGIGAAPLFVFVLGVGWRLSALRRQRAVMIVGMFLGMGYLLHGGMWMMRPTPANAFGSEGERFFVQQSQDYSCVPAASTTALRMIGVSTTETEMARLTETRPGSGATLLRALNGLSERLRGTGIEPMLLEPDSNQLLYYPTPMLAPLKFEPTRLHMVTIVEVRPNRVVVVDPELGVEFIPREAFNRYYTGKVIVFSGGKARAGTDELLAQHPFIQDPDRPERYQPIAQVPSP